MSKHTPKPWYAVRDPSHFHSLSTVVGGSNQELVVQVGGNAPIEEQEANTHLIAAAPDLYAACKAAERLPIIYAQRSECYARLKERSRLTVESIRLTEEAIYACNKEEREIKAALSAALRKASGGVS